MSSIDLPYRARLIGIAVLAFLLAACAGRTSVTPSPAPLTQTLNSADGTITIQYPAGWVANDLLGQITIGNSQAAIDAVSPAPGQFQMRLFVTPVSAIQGLPANATPRQVIEFFAESLSTSAITFNPATDLTIGTRTAARIEGSGTDGHAVVIVVDLGEGAAAFVTATAAPGELPIHEPTLRSILESLVYTPLSPEPEVTP